MFEKMFVFEADKDNSGSAEGSAATETQPGTNGGKTFTQAEVDALIRERLGREKEKTQKALEEARRQAEIETAQKNGEWQKLAETREQELKQIREQLREAMIRATAAKLGFTDLDYAVFLVTRAGEDADAEQVLKERMPAATNAATGAQATNLARNTTNPAQGTISFTRAQLRDPVFFQANKEAILQAAREGRIREE